MAQNRHWEQDKESTVYIGNIDERATSSMVYEIMLQMGTIHNIHMPRDRVTQAHQGFGFVEFRSPADAAYAANVMNGIKLYGKSLRVNKASADKAKNADVGAELFVGNLDAMVDEKILYDTFSRFGPLLSLPKVAREDSGASKGFGFVSFADFESSDAAISNLHGQYILSKEVSVQYAFKKDGKGERHGDQAERELAAQAKKRNLVPEGQAIPQAFLSQPSSNTAPGSSANGAPATGAPPHVPAGFDGANARAPGGPGMPQPPHMGRPPPVMPNPPVGFAHHHAPPPAMPSHRGPPAPYHNAPNGAYPPPGPPGAAAGRGGPGFPLAPVPQGLPARPPSMPQPPPGYGNPADHHPSGSFRPPNGSPAQGGYPVPPPPPGFPGAPPAAGGPPPNFMPPPGFQPPPGFTRR